MKKLLFSFLSLFLLGLLLSVEAQPQQPAPAPAPKPKADPPVLILKLASGDDGQGEQIGIGDMATVSIDQATTAQGITWSVVPMPEVITNWQPHTPSDPTHASTSDYFADLCNGTTPGTFTVIAAGNLNGQTVIAQQVITFGNPPPPVPPTPPMPPNPPPVAGKLWIVTLADMKTLPLSEAELLSDGAYWGAVLKAGHKFKDYDLNDPAAAGWKIPAGMTAPVVFFQDQATNKLLEVDPLPADEAGMTALITKLTGNPPIK